MYISAGFSIERASVQHAEILSEIGGDTFYETFKPYNTESDILQYIKKAYAIDVIKHNLIKIHKFFTFFKTNLIPNAEVIREFINLKKSKIYENNN
jgi:hypothetical protein